WVLLALAALPWTLLGWVNTHPVGRRALASYGLLGAVVLLGELGVRQTALDTVWTRTSGWRRASEEFAELLEIRRYRSYPLDGFPVQPPAPSDKQRIVAMGGSSTGGAFQMDDLSLFWPRRLEELLPIDTWEVVNQGVGGWNTLHVRLYLESQIERLAPDLVVLYVGHNDVLSAAPVPYRELYARYRSGSSAAKAVSSTLHNVRLYVGLKYALLALRDRTGAVAVPTDDARENLTAVLDVADAHGAKVVLVTEGLNPDPVPLRDYAAMQRSLAKARGHYYFDAAEALHREADTTLFLDDCHLSEGGHRRLAALLHAYLREAGLVP
ncbi:MAG: SGNH/GDSL hydrolase family protein, partial [Myxococcota bacterium]